MKADLIKEFNLPSYIKGKSFAEASKAIENKFSERKDPTAEATKKDLMERLAKAQEYVKMQDSLKANSQEVPDMMDGQVPEGFEDFTPQQGQNQMFGGGRMPVESVNAGIQGSGIKTGEYDLQANTSGLTAPGGASATDAAGSATGQITGAIGDVDTALGFGKDMFGDSGVDTTGLAGRQEQSKGAGWDAAGAGIEGATVGAKYGGIWGAAAGAAVGVGSSLIGANKRKNDIHEGNMNASLIQNNKNRNDFALGGFTDPVYGPKKKKKDPEEEVYGPTQPEPNPYEALENSLLYKENEKPKSQPYTGNKSVLEEYPSPGVGKAREDVRSVAAFDLNTNSNLKNDPNRIKDIPNAEGINYTKQGNPKVPNPAGVAERAGRWVGSNAGDILRTAPFLSNAAQLANMKKPTKQRLDRVDSRYETDYVDEKALENRVQNEGNNVANSLAGASNGSMGALRANLLGAHANKTKATSDAFLKADDINRQEDRAAQQFNSRNDMINLRQSNREEENFARDKGAYESNKSALISQMGQDVGSFGKETTNKKQVAELFGYSWDGKYVVNAQGERMSWEEFQKELREYKAKNNE